MDKEWVSRSEFMDHFGINVSGSTLGYWKTSGKIKTKLNDGKVYWNVASADAFLKEYGYLDQNGKPTTKQYKRLRRATKKPIVSMALPAPLGGSVETERHGGTAGQPKCTMFIFSMDQLPQILSAVLK